MNPLEILSFCLHNDKVSSYGGSVTVNGQTTDPGLQLAPPNDGAPDHGLLKKSFEDCILSNQPYRDQTRLNFETRYALWPNQSSDGKKHSRQGDGQPEVVPWDGASDLRVFLTDEAINSKVAMKCAAFRKANIVANPVEGNDIKRSKLVQRFMRWLIQTQIPNIHQEVELLANYLDEKGAAVTGVFWEENQEKTLATVTTQQLQQQFPQMNMQELIFAEEAADAITGIFEEIYGCNGSKAKKMLRELRKTGRTTVATLGRKQSRPVVRAFNLDQDLFIPASTTNIQQASAIWRVQYFTAEQLRAFVHTDEWNADWVEAAIEKCRGKLMTMDSADYNLAISRSFVYQQDDIWTDLIGVVYGYQRLSDEDGVPGLYLTVFSPLLPPEPGMHDGYAKHGLLGYADGKYPFVLHRREVLSRRLHDTRGIPEPGKPFQDQIKVHRDSRIDAASIAILPPLMYPVGRPPGRWGAGARVPERRPGEIHYADRPAPDMDTEKSEDLLAVSFNRYFGFVSKDTDPTFSNLKNQQEVDKFLSEMGDVFAMVWKRYQQFGSDEVYFRVIGVKEEEAMKFTKGDPNEDFDFVLTYSVDSMNPDVMFQKLEQIAKIIATADRDGSVNYSEWLQVMLEAIDPTIADRILDPKNVGQQRVVSEMQDMLAKVYAGQDQDIKLGTPPELGLQVLQGYLQGDPVVQSRMQNQQDPFGKRIEKLGKQLQFQITQRNNAKIGRYGA